MAVLGDDAMDGLSACECPVCFNFLSERLSPMSMPCGHTLCSECVAQLVAEASGGGTPTFRCPLCREWVNRDAVTLNHTLRDLIVQLASIGVNPAGPQSQQARVLSALHVDFNEIKMGGSLDRGAFGEVFRGYWRGNDIAVKLFTSGILTPEAMRAFQQEVFVMNCLRHPNVVLLMGACQTPPKLAILMEFVGGGSLHKLIHVDKVALPLEEVCSLGSDVCRGLQYLHSINILHRDLKSKNVLLSAPPPSGQAKLCDFGLAKMRLESATLTGNVGTVHWSAPEVLANTRYKFPADVYSLGMVLFEMSCGQVPFGSMVPLAVMMAVAINKLKPDIPKTVDPRMSQLISECISWEPGDRPSVGAVLSALHTITPAQTITPTQERRAHLSHSDSLGMVFVSVSDTTDIGDQSNKLVDAAVSLGIVQQEQQQVKRYPSEEDRRLALNIDLEEKSALMAQDEELAHQLQLRENSYLTPSDTKAKLFPPKNVLDMIKSSSGKKTPPPSGSDATPPIHKATVKKKQTPVSKTKTSLFKFGSKKSAKTVPSDDNLSPTSTKKVTSMKKAKMHSKHIPPLPSSQPPPPPRAPPLPPLPPSLRPYTKPQPVLPSRRSYSLKKQLLKEVKKSGRNTAQRLRPVETVEKRAFRVGRVVDGYSSEMAQYTFQNLVRSFNHKLLHHVSVAEPLPAFPVGRVLPPSKGTNVKRLSSIIEQRSFAPPAQTAPPPKILHPAVKKEIAAFKARWLKQVDTSVHNSLPSIEDILSERAAVQEQPYTVPNQSDGGEINQQNCPKLDNHIQADIASFKQEMLNHVAMVIKQWTPTLEDIITEKKRISQSEECAESALDNSSEREPLDGFW